VAQSLSEAFPEIPTKKQWQFHTCTPSGTGSRAAMFHGHEISDKNKDRILRWLRMRDNKLHDLLPGGASPVFLAGVASLSPDDRE
jgi:hypothetical protein